MIDLHQAFLSLALFPRLCVSFLRLQWSCGPSPAVLGLSLPCARYILKCSLICRTGKLDGDLSSQLYTSEAPRHSLIDYSFSSFSKAVFVDTFHSKSQDAFFTPYCNLHSLHRKHVGSPFWALWNFQQAQASPQGNLCFNSSSTSKSSKWSKWSTLQQHNLSSRLPQRRL